MDEWTFHKLPGVSFGANDDASPNGDGVGSITFELEADVDGVEVGLPKGKKRRRLVGRWLSDSQSSDRFKVAHAIFKLILLAPMETR